MPTSTEKTLEERVLELEAALQSARGAAAAARATARRALHHLNSVVQSFPGSQRTDGMWAAYEWLCSIGYEPDAEQESSWRVTLKPYYGPQNKD